MRLLMRKSFGLAAVLTLLAGPALAHSYHHDAPAYAAPYHHQDWQERHETMWRMHERQDAWRHAAHERDYHHGYGRIY